MTSRQVVPGQKYIREPFDCEKCRIEHGVSPYHIGPDKNADCGRYMAVSSMKRSHVNPGCDVTGDPRPPIDDSFRSRGNRTHVLSCDSCDHAEKAMTVDYPFKCHASKPIPMYVHKYCAAWFGYVGCASHSEKIEESEQRAGERK